MDKYLVRKISDKITKEQRKATLTVEVPGSKSITNRALLLATLASGETKLSGVLFSDDSRHFLKCVQELGIETVVNEDIKVVTITGHSGEIPKKEASIYVGSAGTAARFLAATLGVSNGKYYLDASEQMRKRPMAPLLDSLSELGCEIRYGEKGDNCRDNGSDGVKANYEANDTVPGHFPFTLVPHGFGKNEIAINIDSSSQFLSALLIASVLSPEDFTVNVEGSHGMAYIEMTVKMMEQFGVEALKITASDGTVSYRIKANQSYTAGDYPVEPDASAAAYFYAMCPLLGIPVKVPGVHFNSLQGDVMFIKILEQMGCTATEEADGILLTPGEKMVGVDVDMSACSDQAITLAAIAPFAEGPTTIRGIGHIRMQESDRLSAIATELTKMGIKVDEGKDNITIFPGSPKASLVKTYDDHRMAMGFSLIGLKAEGIVIDDPLCCRKTFENYFSVLDGIIAKYE